MILVEWLVMPAIQLGNARRFVFTAMALVAFWILAIRGYWAATDLWHRWHDHPYGSSGVLIEFLSRIGPARLAPIGLSLALIPTTLLHASTVTRFLHRPQRWVWLAGLVIACTCGSCFGLGEHDADSAFLDFGDNESPMFGGWNESQMVSLGIAVRVQPVSWPWLLLPLTLTTAFVIYGAWRRAVRDAETRVVDEDE